MPYNPLLRHLSQHEDDEQVVRQCDMPICEHARFVQFVEGMVHVVDVLSQRFARALMLNHLLCKTHG
jgi:hypothetical protein